MVISTPIVTILALFCYLVLPLVVLLVVKNQKILKTIITSLLFVYLIILTIGVWARVEITKTCVKIAFDYSSEWFSKNINYGFKYLKPFDAFVNILLLVPLGLSYALLAQNPLNKHFYLKLFIIGLIVGIVIEAGQYMLPVKRSVQLSDVVFNTISMLIGGILGVFYNSIAAKIHFSPKQN